MKLIDTFLFFNENDLLKFRIELLYKYVDYFLIVEFDHTFSGDSKGYNLTIEDEFYNKYIDKIIYIKATKKDLENTKLANGFTNFGLIYHHKHNGKFRADELSQCFQTEIRQRDYIIVPLKEIANNEDLIIINDLDEIPNPKILNEVRSKFINNPFQHINLEQKWYLYSIFYKKGEYWYGSRVCRLDYLKNRSVDLMRYNLESRDSQIGEIFQDGGWHFTSFGMQEQILQKMKAYDYQGKKVRFIFKILDFIFPNRISFGINAGRNILGFGKKLKKIDYKKEFEVDIVEIIDRHNIMKIWQ